MSLPYLNHNLRLILAQKAHLYYCKRFPVIIKPWIWSFATNIKLGLPKPLTDRHTGKLIPRTLYVPPIRTKILN